MPGTYGGRYCGMKNASSLAATSWESLAWTAFILTSVPNVARMLEGSVGSRGDREGREELREGRKREREIRRGRERN